MKNQSLQNQAMKSDTPEQLAYLEFAAEEHGYESLSDLFADEPELFDRLAFEWRYEH